MRSFYIIITFFLLTACATPAMTATIPPTITSTATPSTTPTITLTLTPTAEPILRTEARQAATALFEVMDIDPSTYTLKDVNGVIVGMDNESGKEVFRDGKFDLRYAVENIKDPMPTPYEPRSESEVGSIGSPPLNLMKDYLMLIFSDWKKSFPSGTFVAGKTAALELLLDSDVNAWGFVIKLDKADPNGPQYLVYETLEDGVESVPVDNESFDEVRSFYDDH